MCDRHCYAGSIAHTSSAFATWVHIACLRARTQRAKPPSYAGACALSHSALCTFLAAW